MRRVLIFTVLGLITLVGSLAILVNVRSSNAGDLPAPDPALRITMRDGSTLPLGEVLDRLARHAPLPQATGAPDAPAVPTPAIPAAALTALDARTASATEDDDARAALVAELLAHADDNAARVLGPTFALASRQEHQGHFDEALALYQSVREDEPGYWRAQRRIGWHILAKAKHEPARGVPYVQAALRDDPLSGNNWQDLARVYGATLGFEMD